MATMNFKKLTENLTPERRARIEAKKDRLRKEMALADVRRALDRSQVELARAMKVEQPEISKIERRPDMYVSTVRSYVEALGGHLELRAVIAGNVFTIGTVGRASEGDESSTVRPAIAPPRAARKMTQKRRRHA